MSAEEVIESVIERFTGDMSEDELRYALKRAIKLSYFYWVYETVGPIYHKGAEAGEEFSIQALLEIKHKLDDADAGFAGSIPKIYAAQKNIFFALQQLNPQYQSQISRIHQRYLELQAARTGVESVKIDPPVAYSVGLCYASVCSGLDLEDTTAWLNSVHSTGLDHGWSLAQEKFASGEDNPCPCDTDPNRRHYLFSC